MRTTILPENKIKNKHTHKHMEIDNFIIKTTTKNNDGNELQHLTKVEFFGFFDD